MFIIKLLFTKKYYCPFCNSLYDKMTTFGFDFPVLKEKKVIGGGIRKNALCPNKNCYSIDRERLVYLYLKRKTKLLKSNHSEKLALLHIAPEPNLHKLFLHNPNINYFPADKYTTNDIIKPLDITAITYNKNSFDFIICNHVLEHIPNDSTAMKELYRVLKPNGTAILQVPYSATINNTIEDPSVNTDKEREEKFGQDDHVRIYEKKDYIKRLNDVGFIVKTLNPIKEKWFLAKKYAIQPNEDLFIAKK